MRVFPPGGKGLAKGRSIEVTNLVISCLTSALSLLQLINGVLLAVRILFLMQDSSSYEHTPKKNLSESKQGIWGVLARKAKSIIDDNTGQPYVSEVRTRMQHMPDSATIGQVRNVC